MKNNLFIKLCVLLLFSIFCIIPAIAQNKQGIISKILINPLQDNTYTLNVYFDNEYNGKSYIEKNGGGLYSIYLTDSELNLKNTKILYKNNADKRKIKISLDQKPLSTKGRLSNYVAIDVSMNSDYTLQMIPKNSNEDKFLFLTLPLFNSFPLFLFVLCAVMFLLLKKIISISNSSKNNNSFTKFPASFYTNSLSYNNSLKYNGNTINKYLKINKSNKKIETANKTSFKCFDIPFADSKTLTDKSFQKSFLHSNPIETEILDIPFADEVIKDESIPKHDRYGAEIISSIDIDKNKGFYLANANDEICLFGHINHNVFLLKKFKDLTQINLQARYYDKNSEGEIYIVRIDAYKAMIEFSKDSIRELVVL